MSRNEKNRIETGQLIDYVRGLLPVEETEQVRRRIAASAADQRRAAALGHVAELARSEREATPPEWVVRCAKAIGSLRSRRDDARPSLLRRLATTLSFDSLTSPMPIGTRDVQSLDRQMVFRRDGYRIDLRTEPEADLQSIVLVGQLLEMAPEPKPLGDVPVLAMQRDMVVGQTKTGQLGEFQADGLPSSGVDLFLLLDDASCLEVRLDPSERDKTHTGESA